MITLIGVFYWFRNNYTNWVFYLITISMKQKPQFLDIKNKVFED